MSSDDRKISVYSFPEGEDEKSAIVHLLRSELRSGDVVLFKGSRSLAMETLVRDLRTDVHLIDGSPEQRQ